MPARLLVLAIDAASPELLRRWAAAGELPAVRGLLERGAEFPIRGVEGLFVGSTWPSLASGVGPGVHGVHYLAQLPPGRLEYEAVAGRPERAEPVWSRLGRAGRRTAILDVPLSRLAPAQSGVQTVEWGSHDSMYGFRASPAALEQEIVSRFGPHPQAGSCDGVRATAADWEAFVGTLEAGARLKGELTRAILAREDWDLLVQVFTEAHCAGHQCWHLHDPAHPGHLPALAAELGDPLLRVYRAVDAAVGAVVADAPGATVLLLAGHGMSHSYGAQLLLPEILCRLGVSSPLPVARQSRGRRLARRGFRLLPDGVRTRAEPFVRRRSVPAAADDGLPRIPVDVARSRCFPVANGLAVGAIRLNLAGREPAGLLRPEQVDDFCESLDSSLCALVDPADGRPVVRRVVRTGELHPGPCAEQLPDLLVEWADNGPVANTRTSPAAAAVVRASSPEIGTVEATNEWGRTGEHRPEGLLVAAGPGVAAGTGEVIDLLDVAPAIARLLDVDASDLPGRPPGALATALAGEG